MRQQEPRPVRRLAAAALLVAVLPALSGCALREIAPSAINSAAEAAGRRASNVALDAPALQNLSRRFALKQQVLENTVPIVDGQPAWNERLAGVRRVAAAAQDNELTGIGVGVACDALGGDVSSVDDITGSLLKNTQDAVPQNRLRSLADTTYELYLDFETVLRDGTDEDKAAVALMCYVYDVLPAQ